MFFKIGKNIVIREATVQLARVLKAIRFGYNISGMYSQTTGPKESPKSAIKITRPPITITFPADSALSLTKNPIPISSSEMTATRVPPCRIVFLPNRVSK